MHIPLISSLIKKHNSKITKRKNANAAYGDINHIMGFLEINGKLRVDSAGDFLLEFEKSYNLCERDHNHDNSKKNPAAYSRRILSKFEESAQYCQRFRDTRNWQFLGQCFGTLLSTIQYGITSQAFKSEEYFGPVINKTKQIVKSLLEIDIRIRLPNISARIEQIIANSAKMPNHLQFDRTLLELAGMMKSFRR